MPFSDPFLALLYSRARRELCKLRSLREQDRGGLSIEAMIIFGSLVAVAAIAGALLLAKVNEKKNLIK